MPIEEGSAVAPVTATNQAGEQVTVTFDRPTVLFFYPEDHTPGCTTEAEQFEHEYDIAAESGVAVYGISRDDVDAHRQFATDLGLSYDLLADPDGEVADAFGIDRKSSGVFKRSTVVVVDGRVWRTYDVASADGHAREVLTDLLKAGIVSMDT